MNDPYKNCCNCWWYANGKCQHKETFINGVNNAYQVTENGLLAEAIKEGFVAKRFTKLQRNLESKLSKKKAAEFMEAFYEELEQVQNEWQNEIDEAVSTMLIHNLDSDTPDIVNPRRFYCKYYE